MIGEVWRSLEKTIIFPEIVCRILVRIAFSLGRGRNLEGAHNIFKKKNTTWNVL